MFEIKKKKRVSLKKLCKFSTWELVVLIIGSICLIGGLFQLAIPYWDFLWALPFIIGGAVGIIIVIISESLKREIKMKPPVKLQKISGFQIFKVNKNKYILFTILLILAVICLIADIVWLIYSIWLIIVAFILNLTIILIFMGLPILAQALLGLIFSLIIMGGLIYLIIYFNRKRKYYKSNKTERIA